MVPGFRISTWQPGELCMQPKLGSYHHIYFLGWASYPVDTRGYRWVVFELSSQKLQVWGKGPWVEALTLG